MGRKTIYFDMDGVLAVWNGKASHEEVAERGYFLNRDIDFPIVTAVQLLKQAGFDVKVLSAAYTVRACWEKKKWLNRAGLTAVEAVFVPYGECKADYIEEDNAILVDDFGKNLAEWKGIPVKFYNGINGHGGTKYEHYLYHDWDATTLFKKIAAIAV